jgi:predicted ATP-grasp superfamily ATP-dependent carboligase
MLTRVELIFHGLLKDLRDPYLIKYILKYLKWNELHDEDMLHIKDIFHNHKIKLNKSFIRIFYFQEGFIKKEERKIICEQTIKEKIRTVKNILDHKHVKEAIIFEALLDFEIFEEDYYLRPYILCRNNYIEVVN